MGTVHTSGLGDPIRYPERDLAAANKLAAPRGAVIVFDQDGRGEDIFIVVWQGCTRVFLQFDGALRFVQTLPST